MAERRTISQWFAARRLRRRFREVNQRAIGALPEDTFGRLSGTARAFEETLQAPLSDRPCVYWEVEVLEDHGLMAAVMAPRTLLAREKHGVPFILEEEGHRAVVDPTSAQISLAFDFTSTSKAAFDANANQR